MVRDGSGISGGGARSGRGVQGDRVTDTPVLYCDVVPTTTFLDKEETPSTGAGVRAGSGRLEPQKAGRFDTGVAVSAISGQPSAIR